MKKYTVIIVAIVLALSNNLPGQDANTERLEVIVTELASDSYLGRGFGSEQGKLAASYIIEQFNISGIQPFFEDYLQSMDHRSGVLNISGNNIVGIVKGSDPDLANEYIILGAHYDHVGWELEDGDTVVYNGADDNASGVASIIELGRIFNQNREKLGRSILLVAFDGEESGLIGSKAFVKDMIQSEDAPLTVESIVAMFSLDMVGMYEAHKGVDLAGIESLTDFQKFLSKARETSPIEITKINGSIEYRTDTKPFGDIGIASVHVFTGTESPYHKPEDDSNLLDYEGMATIVDFIASLSFELSVTPQVSKSKRLESAAEKGGLKIINPGIVLHSGSSYYDIKNDYYRAKSVFAYSAGGFLEVRLAQWLALQPEVLYEWSGSQATGGSLRTHAINVPVNLLLTTPDQGMGVRTYYNMGGYYRYMFAGNRNGADLDFVDVYSDTDYGLTFGFGFEIMNFRLGYTFQRSLVNFTKNQVDDTRFHTSYVKLGWAF